MIILVGVPSIASIFSFSLEPSGTSARHASMKVSSMGLTDTDTAGLPSSRSEAVELT